MKLSIATMGGVIKQSSFTLAYFNATGVTEWVLVEAVGSTSTIKFTRIGSTFGTYTNALDIKGQIIFELA